MLTVFIAMVSAAQFNESANDPIPLSPPSSWVSPADYPKALREVQGRTVAILSVDASGRVSNCQIKRSSGSLVLDEMVCRRAVEKARLKPARNIEGVVTDGFYTLPVLWGNPDIDIRESHYRLIVGMKNGKATSCYSYNYITSVEKSNSECYLSKEILLDKFGSEYKKADRLIIESITIPGNGPISRGVAEGKRVILKESAITIGLTDGR